MSLPPVTRRTVLRGGVAAIALGLTPLAAREAVAVDAIIARVAGAPPLTGDER